MPAQPLTLSHSPLPLHSCLFLPLLRFPTCPTPFERTIFLQIPPLLLFQPRLNFFTLTHSITRQTSFHQQINPPLPPVLLHLRTISPIVIVRPFKSYPILSRPLVLTTPRLTSYFNPRTTAIPRNTHFRYPFHTPQNGSEAHQQGAD